MIKFILPLFVCCSLHAQIVLDGATIRGATIGTTNATGGGAGPNAWFDSVLTTDGNVDTAGPNFMEWIDVVVSQGGTATKLRWKYNNSSSPNDEPIKIAIYNSTGTTLLGQGVGVVPFGLSTDTYIEVTLSASFFISAGTYRIAQATNPSTGTLKASTQSGANGPYKSQAYSGFPPASLGTEDGHLNQWLAGVFVQ